MSKFCVALAFALVFCGSVAMAADDSTTTANKKMAPEKPADGTVISVSGMMARKADGAKSDVVCKIVNGKGKSAQVYNLVATGTLATTIESKRQNGDKVKVTGKVQGDDLVVATIETQSNMKKVERCAWTQRTVVFFASLRCCFALFARGRLAGRVPSRARSHRAVRARVLARSFIAETIALASSIFRIPSNSSDMVLPSTVRCGVAGAISKLNVPLFK